MGRLPRGSLSKDQPVRTVPVLFPQTRIDLTPEEIAFYRQAKPYPMLIDRQSDDDEMTRADATGCQRRVEAIMGVVEKHGYDVELIRPVPNLNRKDGELPFVYNEAFWFVDGEKKHATGYSANQNARPRLWRAYLLAQALAEHDAAPRQLIVGEATRFFREEEWLSRFAKALRDRKIDLWICPFGEINRFTLPVVVQYVSALSSWLPEIRRGARDARRIQRRLWTIKLPIWLRASGTAGTEPPHTRTHVWTNPVNWSILEELIERLALRTLSNSYEAAEWLLLTHGIKRSVTQVRADLFSTWIEGLYVDYDKRHLPRKVQQEGGLFVDLDICDSGHQRYLIEQQDGIPFPVNYTLGTTPIRTEILETARRSIRGKVGRPGVDTRKHLRDQCVVPVRLTCCVACGSTIDERQPRAGGTTWTLRCNAAKNLRTRKTIPLAEAKARIEAECPHTTEAHFSLSHLVWDLIERELLTQPIPPEEPEETAQQEREQVERQHRIAQERFDQFQERVLLGIAGDANDPDVRATIDRTREQLLRELKDARAAVTRIDARSLTRHREGVEREMLSDLLEMYLGEQPDNAKKKEIIEAIVERVDVHLEERWVKVHVKVSLWQVKDLVGRLAEGESMNGSWSTGFDLSLVLEGSTAA
jgi:hypothetical protein